MGQYVRWQAIIALVGALLLVGYLSSIVVVKTTVVVPAEGGTFREGVIGSARYLNPLLADYNPVDRDLTGLIFEGLTQDDGLGNLSPNLAKNWSVSEDGRVYIFALRPDVKWSDGTPLTAKDVEFTLNLIRDPAFPGNPAWRSLWESVTIQQVDERTIRFELKEPFPSFEYYTTVGILPEHLLRGVTAQTLLAHPFNLAPVGTGPFMLRQITESHATLVRNPRYRLAPSRIEQVVFHFYSDLGALQKAFQNQQIDAAGQEASQTDTFSRLLDKPDVQVYNAPLPRSDIVYFNLKQPEELPFFQDSAIRRALFMAIDRQALIDQTMGGQAIAANGPFLPWSWAYNPDQAYPAYDLLKAAELLDLAGWIDSDGDGVRDNNGRPFAFTLSVSNNPLQLSVAHQLAGQWQKIGVAVTVSTVTDLSTRLAQHQFQSALIEVELFGDPDPYWLWDQTQIENGQNFAGWDNTQASQALEQARTSLDQGTRVQYYYDFQRIFAEEQPALILSHPVYTYILQNNVKNVQMSPMVSPADRFRSIRSWYLLTKRVIDTTANQTYSP